MTAPRTPMRMLMVCMQFPTGAGQSSMTTELAEALAAQGHQVDVLHLDWAAPAGGSTEAFELAEGIRVIRCAPRSVVWLTGALRHAAKFLLSGRHADRTARTHFNLAAYDAALLWMPALAVAPLARRVERLGIANRLLFIWDFFPDHHREIGRIPPGIPYRLARRAEQKLLAGFTAILVTLPGNADYLRRRYRVRQDQKVLVTPIWSDTAPSPPVDRMAIRRGHGLPLDRPIAVFGGQLVEGRGFEQMLAAADLAATRGSPLAYLFVGDGRLSPQIQARARGSANILHRPGMPRADYLELLGGCDVGLVATVPGVSSFSIPTKTIDYLRAGLPIVAALEPGNDLADLISGQGIGLSVPFDDPDGLHAAAERLVRRGSAAAAASRCLDGLFDVRHAVASVLAACGREPTQQARRHDDGGEDCVGPRIAERWRV